MICRVGVNHACPGSGILNVTGLCVRSLTEPVYCLALPEHFQSGQAPHLTLSSAMHDTDLAHFVGLPSPDIDYKHLPFSRHAYVRSTRRTGTR